MKHDSIGCIVGGTYIGAFRYADDLALLLLVLSSPCKIMYATKGIDYRIAKFILTWLTMTIIMCATSLEANPIAPDLAK